MKQQMDRRDLPPILFTHWEYLSPMRKHRSFVAVFILSAVLSALALTYVYSEKYEAAVTLVFTPGEVMRLQNRGAESQALGSPTPHTEFKVVGKTLEQLAQSEGLLREVVAKLNLDVEEDKVYEGPWYIRYYEMAKDYAKEYGTKAWSFLKYGRIPDEDPTVEAVKTLAKDVDVVSEDSYVFNVVVRDKHPKRVAAIADAVANGLVTRANEAYRATARARIGELDTLADEKLGQIAAYQERINGLLRKFQVSSAAQEMSEGLEKLYDLQAERLRLRATIQAEERRLAALEERIRAGERASVQGARIADDRLQADDMKKLISDRLFTQVELAGLRAQHDSLKQAIAEIDARMKQLPHVKMEIDQLLADLSRANREYELIAIARSELEIGSSDTISQIQVQHTATIPLSPVTPIKVYHVALAGSLAAFVAVGLIYVFTYFNVRLFVPSRGVKGRRESFHTAAQPPLGKSNGAGHWDREERQPARLAVDSGGDGHEDRSG